MLSPLVMYYGNYKATLDDDILTEVNDFFMQVCFFFEISLEWWTQYVHYMLQKELNHFSQNSV